MDTRNILGVQPLLPMRNLKPGAIMRSALLWLIGIPIPIILIIALFSGHL